ncbi:MAG: homoserine O-acetyltransferase [Dehalococcoidales bacterium]|nr:homoserine O-acetyltransferase [Dehalococcoidales bacterium]
MNKINSSDDYRTDKFSNYIEEFKIPFTLDLDRGGKLNDVVIAYETYGSLNEDKTNAILICHAITGDSHVAKHNEKDLPGWWDAMVGPGKPIDTTKYFVVCSNILGSCRGTTGPNSINKETGKFYGAEFPVITIKDMVKVQNYLIEYLGIDKLLGVIGGSLGGFQCLEWATEYPEKIKGCLPIASSARLTTQGLAFDVVARNSIISDPNFNFGNYYKKSKKPDVGLALARMLGHITYLSRESMNEKFEIDRNSPRELSTSFEKKFSVGSYLAYQGEKFVERFDANSYITLSTALDLFDLGSTKDILTENLSKSLCDWLLISFSSDWLYPAFQSIDIVEALISNSKKVSYCNVHSNSGHDAFLLNEDIEHYGQIAESFFKNLIHLDNGEIKKAKVCDSKVNIGLNNRIDFQYISNLIPNSSSILDLGCENGDLIEQLSSIDISSALGVEINESNVISCIDKGINVIHSDLDSRLEKFYDSQFDVAILSQTLQSIKNVEKILKEMTRVAKSSIISFPNFAFKPMRDMFYNEGKAPKISGWYGYNWYDTPNVRFPSINDFLEFCEEKNIKIKKSLYLDTIKNKKITDNPNLNADSAIFLIS